MRFRLRTLLILLTFGPPLLAGALRAGKDSWPLFLAMGYTAYIALALLISMALARAIDAFLNLVKQK
jgi:hypothetical protein